MSRSDPPAGRYALLGLLLVATVAYQARISYEIVRTVGGRGVDVRWPVVLEEFGPRIIRVQPPAATPSSRGPSSTTI